MAEKTTFEVGVEVKVDSGEAEKRLHKVEEASRKLAESTGRLRERILGSTHSLVAWGAGIAGVGYGLHALVHQVLESVEGLEKVEKATAGTLFAFSKWKAGVAPLDAMNASMKESKRITEELDATETRFAIPMEQLASGFQRMASSLIPKYGMSLEEVAKINTGAAAAAKVLGIGVEGVSQSITRLLETRNLRGVDPFTNFLRNSLGDTKKLRNMAPDKMIATIMAQMEKLKPAADAMSHGLGDTLFRVKDLFGDTIRDVGVPAVTFIAAKLEAWQKSLQQTLPSGEKLVDVYGKKLKAAIEFLLNATTKIAEHWKIIVAGIAGVKLTGMVQDAMKMAKSFSEAAAAAKLLSGAGGASAGGVFDLIGAKFGLLALKLGVVTAALYALHEGLQWVADGILENQDKKLKNSAAMGAQGWQAFRNVGKAMKEGDETKAMGYLKRSIPGLQELGIIDKQGKTTPQLAGRLRDLDDSGRKALAEAAGFKNTEGLSKNADLFAETFFRRWDALTRGNPEMFAAPKALDIKDLTKAGKDKRVSNFYGPIHINQDFKEADPDNVFLRFKEDLEGQAERVQYGKVHSAFAENG